MTNLFQPKTAFSFVLIFAFLWTGSNSSEWKLAKDKNDIQVYTRKVDGYGLKEYKAVTEVSSDIETVLALITDFPNYINWQDKCIESRVIERPSNSKYISYMQIAAPWPASNRDLVYSFEVVSNSNGTVRCEYENLDGVEDKNRGVVRIPHTKGYWILESSSDGGTLITQQVLADPGGNVPDWLANSAVVDTPYTTFKSMREILK